LQLSLAGSHAPIIDQWKRVFVEREAVFTHFLHNRKSATRIACRCSGDSLKDSMDCTSNLTRDNMHIVPYDSL